LLPVLQQFSREAPEWPVQLAGVHEHAVSFAREDVDLAIVYKPQKAIAGNETLLLVEQLTPVIAPQLLAKPASRCSRWPTCSTILCSTRLTTGATGGNGWPAAARRRWNIAVGLCSTRWIRP
jgi:DNA-binding transcriptional LysR family regulator